ncbi:MAG: lysozyme inhibitor LprI family protein [Lysobacteraceae bacterium]
MRDRNGLAVLLALAMLAACDRADQTNRTNRTNQADLKAARASTTAPVPAAEVPVVDRVTANDVASAVDAPTSNVSTVDAPTVDAPTEAAPETGPPSLRASFTQCAEASGGVDTAMQDCIASEYGYQDQRLNAVYAELKRNLPAENMTALRTAQRQWLVERDSRCTWDAKTEGSAQRLQANYCRMESTAKRADVLEAMR